ncbi:MAG TPA: IclR family transcriptional regulator, partial [Desulfitobacteriaceae bacterium]|nr:IclR family transcriptional regulator [Desulfitobacteriaceae bacterium]
PERMNKMRLKEKTHRKFVDYFEKMSSLYKGNEFELAYSDIQRETGAASVTLKRAIQSLEKDGVIRVQPGRNSRYARFQYLAAITALKTPDTAEQDKIDQARESETGDFRSLVSEVNGLTTQTEYLRRRVRIQEMAIAILQERLAEMEEKITRNNN